MTIMKAGRIDDLVVSLTAWFRISTVITGNHLGKFLCGISQKVRYSCTIVDIQNLNDLLN